MYCEECKKNVETVLFVGEVCSFTEDEKVTDKDIVNALKEAEGGLRCAECDSNIEVV